MTFAMKYPMSCCASLWAWNKNLPRFSCAFSMLLWGKKSRSLGVDLFSSSTLQGICSCPYSTTVMLYTSSCVMLHSTYVLACCSDTARLICRFVNIRTSNHIVLLNLFIDPLRPIPTSLTAPRPSLELTQRLNQWVSSTLSPEVNQPVAWVDFSSPSSAEVNNIEAVLPLPHMEWCYIN
jgi:hypothetical protein